MPAPTNSWSHYISVITQVQNRIIKEDFKDVGDDRWEPDISTPRGSLRVACTIKATDSAPIVLLRLMLYYIVLRKAQDLQIPVYGIPIGSLNAQRKYRPHVFLYFSQDALNVQKGDDPITGRITWRIMDETSSTMTRSKVEILANRIKSEFGSGQGFIWRKGKKMVSYTDWDEGLQLQILSRDENEGERVIKKVLDVAGVAFDPKRCNLNKNKAEDSRYPSTKRRENILGESVELPRERPEVDVRFRYATLSLHGTKKPVHLYDKTLQLVDCVVR
jgi:hypothetical protein